MGRPCRTQSWAPARPPGRQIIIIATSSLYLHTYSECGNERHADVAVEVIGSQSDVATLCHAHTDRCILLVRGVKA